MDLTISKSPWTSPAIQPSKLSNNKLNPKDALVNKTNERGIKAASPL